MAPHTRDDNFHEIQLNGKQLVFLFMAATVACVVIFLCGLMVGRGVRVARDTAVDVQESEQSPIADARVTPPPDATEDVRVNPTTPPPSTVDEADLPKETPAPPVIVPPAAAARPAPPPARPAPAPAEKTPAVSTP
ncbi:MAG: hypothetical protein LBQ09_06840, partial [Acidobacteriaceae bacterium]|nr:hypothetical protein [Acidobacteriaceae bacterium]